MKRSLFITAAAVLVALPVTGSAQVSALYLTQFDSSASYIVQGGSVIGTFNRSSTQDNALAITSTIKSFQRSSGNGFEYDLAGNAIGGLGSSNPGFEDCYDGATDGTRTWTVAHNDFGVNFAVIQGGADWSGAGVAFTPADRSSGIAFDSATGTLWIAKNVGGTNGIRQYTTGGTLLGGFDFTDLNGAGYGLAYDAADDTLWIAGAFGTSGHLYQYSKAGVLLNDLTVSGLAGTNIVGAEFAAVPEPASLIALGVGAVALLRRRRKA